MSMHPSRVYYKGRQGLSGFTLIEMVLSLVIMGIIATAGWPVITNLVKSMLIYDQTSLSADEGSWAMNRMSQELRQASRDGLLINTSNEITFNSTATDEGTIRFYLKDNGWAGGKDLMRQVAGVTPGDILARGMDNLVFTYDTADANTVNYVGFELTVNSDLAGGGAGNVIVPFRTKIYPRNF
ncbi:MAG: type II secretion system protein [Magnetococcales bacterium]|nr:type II secretion system protein [Magnetococcales bacterium]